jgi:hypothetical protein
MPDFVDAPCQYSSDPHVSARSATDRGNIRGSRSLITIDIVLDVKEVRCVYTTSPSG